MDRRPHGSGPLAGLSIVVTRPADSDSRLSRLLQDVGASTIEVPLVELVEVADDAEVAAEVGALGERDWVVATSAAAARRVAVAVRGRRVHLAAVGSATARVLPWADLVAERQSAEGLLGVMPACDPPGSARALVVQSMDGAPTLVEGLAALGWRTQRLDSHRTRPVVPTAAEQLAVLRADIVVFTSGTQARAWVDVFGTSTPAVVVSIGPQTTKVAEEAGIAVQVTAVDHSFPGVVDAVRQFVTRGLGNLGPSI